MIASSNHYFLRRFGVACRDAELEVGIASDGYEALTTLEQGGIDLLLVDGGDPGSASGLNGIAGDELSHMWRQIEGRANHLLIGYVSERNIRLSDRRGVACAPPSAASRFFVDPALVVSNRGVDFHFWSDESDDEIIGQLVRGYELVKETKIHAVEGSLDPRISRIADHKKATG